MLTELAAAFVHPTPHTANSSHSLANDKRLRESTIFSSPTAFNPNVNEQSKVALNNN